MKRRDILKYTALATGAAISAPLMTTLLSGCQTDDLAKLPDYKPTFFSEGEFSVLKILIDLILPKTDSPSASAVGVQNIIDSMVGKVYQPEDQAAYKTAFIGMLNLLNGGPIEDKTYKGFKKSLKTESLQALISSSDEGKKKAKDALITLQQQTVAYYLSTEEIGKNYLNYLPVPGEYQACIPLSEVGGKAWAI